MRRYASKVKEIIKVKVYKGSKEGSVNSAFHHHISALYNTTEPVLHAEVRQIKASWKHTYAFELRKVVIYNRSSLAHCMDEIILCN